MIGHSTHTCTLSPMVPAFISVAHCVGRTLLTGDRAEELTSEVPTKREESPLQIRAMQEEQYSKAVLEDQVNFLSFNTT